MPYRSLLQDHRICLAPMLDWTDRHFRYFIRLLSQRAVLYTEMITTGALLYGPKEQLLDYDPLEHPVALQLGGSDPGALAQCAQMVEQYGYDEVNLNVGCPSTRVQSGRFGACLMREPTLVAECIAAMRAASQLPVTVKCRIGVDEHEDYADLASFVDTVHQAGCDTFIVHARKAWLNGLSPKQNRAIPPLKYDYVYQLKQAMPQCHIIINGGIETLLDIQTHLAYTDGVMIGRAAYKNPSLFMNLDNIADGNNTSNTPTSNNNIDNQVTLAEKIVVMQRYQPYIDQQFALGVKLSCLLKPILGLFHGEPKAKQWRRFLSTQMHQANAQPDLLVQSLLLFD